MARGFFEEKIHQLFYFYRGTGMTGVIREIARKLIAPIYKREVQYIMVQNVESQEAAEFANEKEESPGTEFLILDSPQSLRTVQNEIPSSFRYSVEDFKKQLEQGCVIFLARRPKSNGSGKEVVGYAICQQGVFSVFGHLRKISSDFLFSHYGEVLPEYRGQGIHLMSNRDRNTYCRSNGIKKRCSSVGIHNRPSIIGRRDGSTIKGTIEQVSVFGGLFKWETPWEKIEAALRRGES